MKTTRRIVIAALAALWLAAPAPGAAEPSPLGPPTLAGPDKLTLQKVHDGDQTQLAMGKLAEDKGSPRAVRGFGRRLVTDSKAAERKLDAYLRTRGGDLSVLATKTNADTTHELLAAKT